MLNFFKLKEGANTFFLIVVLVVGFLWTLSQAAILTIEYVGYKEFAKETKTIEYVIKKDGKVFRNTYDVTAYVDAEGVFYTTSITQHKGEK